MGQCAICLSLNMTANLFVILLLISCERVMSQGQGTGDICAIQDTNGLGICKRVTDCPTVLEDLKKRKITHTRCGFDGKTEIVCCPYSTTKINSSPVNEGSIKYFVMKSIGNNQKTGGRLQSQRVCTKTTGYEDVINEINLMELPSECGSDYDVESVCCPDITFRFGSSPPGQVKRMRNKSQEKCKEFGKLVFENVTVLSPINEEGITVLSDTCTLNTESYAEDDVFRDDNGYRVVVVGGEEAADGEFPHMAVLGFNAGIGLIEWMCGATLISENYLLTAGHCINHGIYGDVAYARLGTNDIEKEGSGIVLSIVERIPYPSYDPLINYDDIGLLKLNESVVFRTGLRPACLPTEFDGSEQLAIATGWGQTAYSGPTSALLLKVTLEKFSFEECNDSYTADDNIPRGILKETQFCVGHRTEVKDTCQGDSGGPLQVFHSTQYCSYTIIGVTSFGKVCAQIGTPGVYTRVYSYLDWIEGIVWK